MSRQAPNSGSSSEAADPRIDLYLDGLLSGEALERFERDLAGSEGLQSAVALQTRMDDELRQLFPYDAARAASTQPGAPPAEVLGRVDGGRIVTRSASRTRWYAAAAVLLLSAAVLSVYLQNRFTPSRTVGPAQVYAMVDQPEFICNDDREFAEAVRSRLGTPLVLAAAPGIEALGWAYGDNYNGDIVGSKTMVLITRVRGDKVLVFMDRLSADRPLTVAPESGLRLFRRESGSLVLYELTPHSEPEVVSRLHPPGEAR